MNKEGIQDMTKVKLIIKQVIVESVLNYLGSIRREVIIKMKLLQY